MSSNPIAVSSKLKKQENNILVANKVTIEQSNITKILQKYYNYIKNKKSY
ncbi:MAG: hypothetical protein IJ777_00720 [Clostridia bacterium]|nr:hypothetical protein [Clostridia bacterium]